MNPTFHHYILFVAGREFVEEGRIPNKINKNKTSAKVVDDIPTGIDMTNPKCGIIDPNK